MSTKLFILAALVISSIVIGYLFLDSSKNVEYLSKIKHETENWAIIEDSKGDIIAIETTDPKIWISLKELDQNQSIMWIGGIIEEYDNYWGFRFKPDTIIIGEITIEGAQSNIKGISQDLNYWINTWTKQTYVLAQVKEINE